MMMIKDESKMYLHTFILILTHYTQDHLHINTLTPED